MKNRFLLLAFALFVMLLFSVNAKTATIGELNYELSETDKTTTLIASTVTAENLTIPSTIVVGGDFTY